jgi:hypothetical protein
MNRSKPPGLASLIACLALAAPAALAQAQQPEVAPLLRLAEAAPLPQVYELANQVADLAPDSNTDGFRDKVLTAMRAGDGSEKGRLAAALVLRTLADGTTYGNDVFTLL